MDVDESFVKRISELSYLNLDRDQITHFAKQMKKILKYAETLEHLPEVDQENDRMPEAKGSGCLERDDIAESCLEPDLVTREAPDVAGTSFRVPRVVE